MTESPSDRYDVAISFLAADEARAKALADKLEANGLKVFFYPRRQEQLAGTDGLETMRRPFIDALVNVVLFKEGWGETPWTRVEAAAIKDWCLRGGWPGLMFVSLDQQSGHPAWLPDTHIRFNFEQFGLEQLVGAIKARVVERGGKPKLPDARSEARRVMRDREFQETRASLMRDRRWIESNVHKPLVEVYANLKRLAEESNAETNSDFRGDIFKLAAVLRSGFVSVGISFDQPFFHTIADEPRGKCALRVTEYSGHVPLRPDQYSVLPRGPRKLAQHEFKPDVSEDHELVWIDVGSGNRLATSQLGDRLMLIFLNLVSRADSGLVQRPSFFDDDDNS